MSRNFIARQAVTAGLILLTTASCVYIDEGLGTNFIPEDRIYTVNTATFPLSRIKVGLADSLSGYSSSRITVGEIRNDYAWEAHGSAMTLIPVNDGLDFGENLDKESIRFHFTAVRDTFSVCDLNQQGVIQEIYVYELNKPLDEDYMYIGKEPEIKSGSHIGYAPYSGGDSLSFNFSRDFAERVITAIREMDEETYDDLEKYAEKLPGIYIAPQPFSTEAEGCLDEPKNRGGRVNMFELPIQISDSYYVTGNYAELAFTSDYGDRKQVDTSFLFYFGPQERKSNTTQYALNVSRNSSEKDFPWTDAEKTKREILRDIRPEEQAIYVEGGAGLKPVVSAAEIKHHITGELKAQGIDPNTVIINKATVVLPYKWDAAFYEDSFRVPQMLNPTSRITGTATDEDTEEETPYVTFAGLTDASIETENQGDIDRSLLRYAPDISHHVQTILKLDADADLALSEEGDTDFDADAAKAEAGKFADYDIWMLIMADETITKNQDNSYMDEYYQDMAYANYYNSMYDPYGYGYGGYGYGGYGYGYGSYGYGYNNYYNYLAMSQMYGNSGTSTSTVTQLDKDRYYRCELVKPVTAEQWEELTREEQKAKINGIPHLKIIYSYIRSEE